MASNLQTNLGTPNECEHGRRSNAYYSFLDPESVDGRRWASMARCHQRKRGGSNETTAPVQCVLSLGPLFNSTCFIFFLRSPGKTRKQLLS